MESESEGEGNVKKLTQNPEQWRRSSRSKVESLIESPEEERNVFNVNWWLKFNHKSFQSSVGGSSSRGDPSDVHGDL